MKELISLCKRRGFIFQGSEIYGGLANTWDYGPVGVELKNRIKQHWWKSFVQDREDIFGLDSAILLNPRVWEASGHIGNFNDYLMDCRSCKSRFRADKLIEEFLFAQGDHETLVGGWDKETMENYIAEHKIPCPECGGHDFTEMRQFNLMFETHQGVVADSSARIFMRPETAQGIFINFRNIMNTMRPKLPFGVGQIGKSFRNEITPGNFIFRTREFEQMEMEYFCRPENALTQYEYWCQFCMDWLQALGIRSENLRLRAHDPEELSHYSQATSDIEYKFPFGWGELWGVAHRGDFDLSRHEEFSGQDLHYQDLSSNEKFIPHVIEPALGVDRLLLAILADAYQEEEVNGETRAVLRLHPSIAPIQVAILPLSKKLNDDAYKLYKQLQTQFVCDFDTTQSIGKRYRRQDEIGTPYCVTLDFDSLEDQAVTIRERDTMSQERIPIAELSLRLAEKLKR
ncbi:glycine--tRNA ligase [bacterium (Candidatus Blackallbacteria) CG17_big_fil_post_rev_8_21_14_2_50_48_46]|uniref:Glycine--tRNA ligase n=1 Tax=bacterium (Candidatus Blackallbacteria) CG17_big_fil_post_rev_8_21_14_2_50_48_46 TaxID=2014261 RepID=A0A2M7GAZ8_9BACT|nr:MAG: glycine--tRNA ligase [bacterium (Candidatus Blackallbacteria) CG18_big_fil_WC_8_21_14_2_50_49_26]PIW19359.1 MAG: glycine--tRNA ligase [bacterium (Candidatus Blackallbacteria) CG17_big_fil_post_rev_8_21_14_2_50_48_46]PIW49037.1 MAG: glycine--tRNA ligase [bacterium (Candidatus Blackallbacteria) CG13_big_fil_rev_8_21_14_2_50_49_14]